MENLCLKPKKNHRGDSGTCLTILFWSYKKGAAKRGYTFELTKEQFKEFTKQNCWYCGVKPAQIKYARYHAKHTPTVAYYLYNGVDRVDNEVGYTEANCIPCCGRCNRMKNVLHAEDFIIHIRTIAQNLNIF